MVRLTNEMQALMQQVDVFPLATADLAGEPNVVPVRYVRVHDASTLWITDNFFQKTLANIRANPRAALYVWSPEGSDSFQFKGSVELLTIGPDYERMRAEVLALRPDLPAKSLVILRVTAVYDCRPGDTAGMQVL